MRSSDSYLIFRRQIRMLTVIGNSCKLSANSFFCDKCKTSEKVYMLHKKPACGKSYPHFPQYIHRFIHNETSEK